MEYSVHRQRLLAKPPGKWEPHASRTTASVGLMGMEQLMSPVSRDFHLVSDPADCACLDDIDIEFSGKDAVLRPTDMTTNYITQFSKLKSMGDQLVSELSSHLGLSSNDTNTDMDDS